MFSQNREPIGSIDHFASLLYSRRHSQIHLSPSIQESLSLFEYPLKEGTVRQHRENFVEAISELGVMNVSPCELVNINKKIEVHGAHLVNSQ